MQISNIYNVSWECIHFVDLNPIESILTAIENENIQLFIINNVVIDDEFQLLEAISATMRFPDYFGYNWDALDECLLDLEWLPSSKGYVLLIQNSKTHWQKASLSLGKLIESWLYAAEEWGKKNVSFHLIFANME